MKYNPDIHHRQSIRLRGYDYSLPGAYFITICIDKRECLLGDIQDGNVIFSRYGEVVHFNWFNLTKVYPGIQLDSFVIMPNHIHGIIILTDNSHKLSEIVRGLKTFSARRINQLRSLSGISVWQRGYYEHIIRNENTLTKIQEYILNNPYNWETDEMHPSKKCPISQKINIKFNDHITLQSNLLS
ncbi:MAG: transposase [Limnoraphis robusta]